MQKIYDRSKPAERPAKRTSFTHPYHKDQKPNERPAKRTSSAQPYNKDQKLNESLVSPYAGPSSTIRKGKQPMRDIEPAEPDQAGFREALLSAAMTSQTANLSPSRANTPSSGSTRRLSSRLSDNRHSRTLSSPSLLGSSSIYSQASHTSSKSTTPFGQARPNPKLRAMQTRRQVTGEASASTSSYAARKALAAGPGRAYASSHGRPSTPHYRSSNLSNSRSASSASNYPLQTTSERGAPSLSSKHRDPRSKGRQAVQRNWDDPYAKIATQRSRGEGSRPRREYEASSQSSRDRRHGDAGSAYGRSRDYNDRRDHKRSGDSSRGEAPDINGYDRSMSKAKLTVRDV